MKRQREHSGAGPSQAGGERRQRLANVEAGGGTLTQSIAGLGTQTTTSTGTVPAVQGSVLAAA